MCSLLGISRSTLYRWCNMSGGICQMTPSNLMKNLMTPKGSVLSVLVGMPNDDEADNRFSVDHLRLGEL